MRKNSYLLFLLIGLGARANAFDLKQAYDQAINYNADYLSAIASNQAGQEWRVQGLASLLPQVGAGAGLNENYYRQNKVDESGFNTPIKALYNQPIYTANLSQVIFDFSKFSQYSKSKYQTELSNLQLENARQRLMVTISQAYFDVLYARDSLKAIEMTKAALGKQMEQAKKSFTVGTVTIADVNDALSAYDLANSQLIQAQNNLINVKNVFNNLTGLDPDEINVLKEDIDLNPLGLASDVDWSKSAEVGNMDIKIGKKQLDMAKEDVSIARGGHLPTLNLNGQYTYQDTGKINSLSASPAEKEAFLVPGGKLDNFQNGYIGLQLNVPIYQGGMVNSKVRQAAANYTASQQQLTQITRNTDQNTKNAYWQVQNGISIVKAQKTALKSADTKLKSDQLGYSVGVRNSVDLVLSQRNYYTIWQDYQRSRYQYLMAKVQLQYLSGKIDDGFINDIDKNISSKY